MTVIGVQEITYGVDDVAACVRFHEDFGLPKADQGEWGADFVLDEGSIVRVRSGDDPELPARWSERPGVREVIWGVDGETALATIETNLRSDRTVARGSDGTVRTVDDQGIAIGFRVFDRKPPLYDDDRHNNAATVNRWNKHRKWFKRAEPKLINHVVFGVPDVDAAVDFYVNRLGFRLTDISRGLGVFLRCDGRHEHHNLFFLKCEFLQAAGPCWHHVCYGVENIDEIMAGANHLQKLGYESPEGIGRHRIASALFYYVDNPGGGTSEYGADTDHLDDDWKPRLWEPMFGNFFWVGRWPEWAATDIEWNVRVLDGPVPSFRALSEVTE